MEDVLDTYALPRDHKIPLVCMDEQPIQLLGDRFKPIDMQPGSPAKEDFQYTRNGTASIFMFTAPLECWRHVDAQEHRTKLDWAHQIHTLLTKYFKDATKIRLVMDNLNTHVIGALYEAYSPEIARELVKRLEIHYTPKHGSWLNIAEIELSAMTRQCLDRRIDNLEELRRQVSAWELHRNSHQESVNWHFTTDKARGKLKSLYPEIIITNI